MEIITTPTFEKNVKRIAKKDTLLYKDLENLLELLTQNPKSGTPLGNNTFKIRIKNSSATKGKSGGYRVISYYASDDFVGLLTIYSKSQRENIFENEIDALLYELSLKVNK